MGPELNPGCQFTHSRELRPCTFLNKANNSHCLQSRAALAPEPNPRFLFILCTQEKAEEAHTKHRPQMFPSPRPSTQSRCKGRVQPPLLPCPSAATLQPASPHSLCTSTGLPVSPICEETPESESQRNHLSGGQVRSILLDTGCWGALASVGLHCSHHRREPASGVEHMERARQ